MQRKRRFVQVLLSSILGSALYLPTMSNVSAITLNDLYLRLLGNPVSVIVVMLAQMPFFYPGDWDYFWKATTIGILFTGIMWEIGRQIILHGRRRFPGLHQTKKRVFWIFSWVMVQYTIGQGVVTQVYFSTGLNVDKSLSFVETWFLYLCTTVLFIVVIMGIYEAIYFFSQYKIALQKAEHLKKQQARSSLDLLKNRVNPHFLFNSLTTLSALIGEDALLAERFVDELSKVYRYLLRAGRQPTVTLNEELQFVDSYVFLLKNRFEEGAFSFSIQPGAHLKLRPDFNQTLPALSLQNALDYLVRTQNLPLKIEVNMFDQHLSISCDHQPKSISFDLPDNDWQHLENNGAKQALQSGQLVIRIPFTPHTSIA